MQTSSEGRPVASLTYQAVGSGFRRNAALRWAWLLFAALLMTAPACAAGRVALVIGNADYEQLVPLATPVSDARAVGDALTELGFDVWVGTNLGGAEMREMLRGFVQNLHGAEVALFYYAGHSVEVDGADYLMPVDAGLETPELVPYTAVQAEEFFRYLGSDTRAGVAFLDTSRRPFAAEDDRRTGPSLTGSGQLRMDTPNLIAGYAASPGAYAFDGNGARSAFTEALVTHLTDRDLSVGELMAAIQQDVNDETLGRQQPWVASTLSKDVHLAPYADDDRLGGTAGGGPAGGGGPSIGAGDAAAGGDPDHVLDAEAIFEEDSFDGDTAAEGGLAEAEQGEAPGSFGGVPAAPVTVPGRETEDLVRVLEPARPRTRSIGVVPAPSPEPGIEVASLPAIEIISPADRSGERFVAMADEIEVVGRITGSAESVNLVVVDGEPVTIERDFTFRRTVQLSGRSRVTVLVNGAGGLLRWPIEFERPAAMSRMVAQGRRYALIIGNQDYDDDRLPDLRFPLADAAAVAEVLKTRFGFETSLTVDDAPVSLELHDPSLREIEKAMNALRSTLEPQDSLVVYYAGHGIWQEDIGLAAWLPQDADPDFMSSMFRSDLLHSLLSGMKARKILVVSDSCYAGRMMRGEVLTTSSDSESDLAEQRQSRVFLAAGDREPVPDGGSRDGRNSLFAASFLVGLESMGEDEFTAQELFVEYIEPLVGSPDQEPVWSPIEASGHEGGDFVFSRTAGG